MYWEKILKEVLNKGNPQEDFLFTSCGDAASSFARKRHPADVRRKRRRRRRVKGYLLGEKFADIYFTRREAQCMVELLQGKTLSAIAKQLSLSPRTIEFYVNQMKMKVDCRTKQELISAVQGTEFMKHVDFEPFSD